MALQGPAGSGKTFTSMTLLRALTGDAGFAVIDTERRALEYAQIPGESRPDRFEFLHHAPAIADPDELPGHIAQAAAAGVGGLLIDSHSLYWSGSGGALDRVDRKSDKRAGWNEYRPIENAVRDALLTFPGHLICTMRVKTEHVTEVGANGRTTTKKLGLKADQRDTADYEFSVIGEMDADHVLRFTKTTCPDLVDRSIPRPGDDLVATLSDWLAQGAPVMDVNQIRAEALDEATGVARLRDLYAYAYPRHLLGAPVLDEHERTTTLARLLNRLGAERATATPATERSAAR